MEASASSSLASIVQYTSGSIPKITYGQPGRVAELVDALDSKSSVGNNVRVQVPPRPPLSLRLFMTYLSLLSRESTVRVPARKMLLSSLASWLGQRW